MNDRGSHPMSMNMCVGKWYRKSSSRLLLKSRPNLIEGVKLVAREQGEQSSRVGNMN